MTDMIAMHIAVFLIICITIGFSVIAPWRIVLTVGYTLFGVSVLLTGAFFYLLFG